MRPTAWLVLSCALAVAVVAVAVRQTGPLPPVELWPGSLRFDAVLAHRQAARLAEGFPYRPTGSVGAVQSVAWLEEQFRSLGLRSGLQRGSAVLDGRRVPLVNVYAVSPGRTAATLVLVANYDMAPTSYQAASDTAAGIGVLLELARIFAAEPHDKTIVFFAPGGEEWGMLGARLFAFAPPVRGPLVASIVVEDLTIGRLQRLVPTMTGQFRGYTPLWLRELARQASAAEGLAFLDPPLVLEYADRAILIPATDQGPFLAASIPSIELTTEGDQQELFTRVYHMPGDVMELLRVDAFHTFGRIAERMVRTVDRQRVPSPEGDYLRLGDGVLSGWPLRLAQTIIFLPLFAAAILAVRRFTWLPAVTETARRFAILGIAYAAVLLLPSLGLLPEFELYPPPPKHPLLFRPDWLPFLVPLLTIVGLALIARRLQSPSLAPEERRAGALLALTILTLGALLLNPFAATTFLALPVWLWIWVGPGGRLRALGNIVLLLAGWTVVAVLIQVQSGFLHGANLPWYFLLATAYGQFTPAHWLPTFGLVAVWTQLLQVGLSRPDHPHVAGMRTPTM